MDLVPVVDIAHPEATSLTALDRACSDLAARTTALVFAALDLGADDTQIAAYRIAG